MIELRDRIPPSGPFPELVSPVAGLNPDFFGDFFLGGDGSELVFPTSATFEAGSSGGTITLPESGVGWDQAGNEGVTMYLGTSDGTNFFNTIFYVTFALSIRTRDAGFAAQANLQISHNGENLGTLSPGFSIQSEISSPTIAEWMNLVATRLVAMSPLDTLQPICLVESGAGNGLEMRGRMTMLPLFQMPTTPP